MNHDHPWYRPRHYIHFDPPVSLNNALKYVTNEERVATHPFYPLISYQIKAKKIKHDCEKKKLVKKIKPRDIAYAAHLDSCIYSYYAWKLGSVYENELKERKIDDHVLAFRSLGKSNIEFASQVFRKIKAKENCGVVALDIKGFFDNLDHKHLKRILSILLKEAKLPRDYYAIFRSLTSYSAVDRKKLFAALNISQHNPKYGRYRICSAEDFRDKVRKSGLIVKNMQKKGIPQGTPISALLSNIYMIEFDELMCKKMSSIGGEYFRYCDDMLFIVPTEKINEIAGKVRQRIQVLGIDINTDKTELRIFTTVNGEQFADKPLQYLGFTYDGQRTLLRSAALARYSDRMKRGVKLAKATMKKRNKSRLARGEPQKELFKKKLYKRYSHLGSTNFVRYGYKAASIMDSPEIKRQLKPLWFRLQKEIEK